MELDDSHVTNMKFLKFKLADSCHIKNPNRFNHNSAADCPISVNFCAGKQFSQNFDIWTDTRVPQNVLICFPNAVWASASGGFRIVSDTPVCNVTRLLLMPTLAALETYLTKGVKNDASTTPANLT